MDIASVQKRKFLNNIYKVLYSDGKKPSEQNVREAFNEYFSINKPGRPIRVDYSILDISDVTDVDALNELMVTNLLNLEVLYDAIFENNQQLFSVVTALNNKLNGLRVRRKFLEAKVDDLLFANSNSDGFFYSFAENFTDLSNLDMSLTTAFVDVDKNYVTIPKITNTVSDTLVGSQYNIENITATALFDGVQLGEPISIQDFDKATDGLNDTYWSYEIQKNTPGIAALTMNIPTNSSYSIARVEGVLFTSSPCSVYLSAKPSDSEKQPVEVFQDSTQDYSKFVFSIPAQPYSSVTITLVKAEPDRVGSSTTGAYTYVFGFREFLMSSSYHDVNAVLVSGPISVQTQDNKNLAITAVSMEVKDDVLPGTNIQYYVAADNGEKTGLSEFNWIRIDPSVNNEKQSVVSLAPSNLASQIIDEASASGVALPLIPLSDKTNAPNANDANPTKLPFSDKNVYRIAAVTPNINYIEPTILASLDTFRHYSRFLSEGVTTSAYLSNDLWNTYINDKDESDLTRVDFIPYQSSSLNPSFYSASIAYMETKLMCPAERVVTHRITKDKPDVNLAVFLNDKKIADLPSGTASADVTWNFVAGSNKIVITYDKPFYGVFSFNLMTGRSLTEYGTMYLDSFRYLDPIQFRNNRVESAKVFTIDTINQRKEILCPENINRRSIIRYYSGDNQLVKAIRYRADLSRFTNPLQSPVIKSIRVKFRHSDADT